MPAVDSFLGTIGNTWRDSSPWWPPEPAPPEGAPNVLLVVLDDVGYAQLGCYGSDIATPTFDALAAGGVRLARFHTTALCSPTRACLLSGRNHHSVGVGRISDLAMGYPGYLGRIPPDCGLLPEVLGEHGWSSYAVGKWHLSPDRETHLAASRATWPLGRGFQRWYGFHGGETHQFAPSLFHDNHAVRPEAIGAGDGSTGYHVTSDLVDHARTFLADHRAAEPSRPWFLYVATGACHSPHQAPADWVERYRGRFDGGWDRWRDETFARQIDLGLFEPGTPLPDRPPWVPAWDSLQADDQRVAARFQECFAAFLSHTDHEVGRLLSFVADELGELDNTIVVVVSDNGASSEGGEKGSINDARTWNGMAAGRRELRARIDEIGTATSHNNYPWGWTMAGNTPFRRWKREVHEGGIADPCIVRWPSGLGADVAGTIRHHFTHAIDVLPTICELVGVDPAVPIAGREQRPFEGASFAAALRAPEANPHRTTQYFEMLGSRAIYHDGWKAVTFKPLARMYDDTDPEAPFEDDRWELFHLASDPAEAHDLAAERPDKLAEMVDRWWAEARAHQVLPLDNRPLAAMLDSHHQPPDHRRVVYRPGGGPVPEESTLALRGRSHEITAQLTVDEGSVPSGVLLAMGCALGGWTFHLIDGNPRYVHNVVGWQRHEVSTDAVVVPGEHDVTFRFDPGEGFAGTGVLLVDGAEVGRADIPLTTPMRFSITGGGITCGEEWGPAVADGYEAPFRFRGGTLHRVVVTTHAN